MLDSVAVAIHDVSPATLDDCVAIRETLDDWRIDRATLLAIPTPGGEPLHRQCSETPAPLRARVASGDAVAQHGLRHARCHRRAIEALLRRACPRRAVSYDDLAAPFEENDAAGDTAATSIGQAPGGGPRRR
jgi:predicted deacetylase